MDLSDRLAEIEQRYERLQAEMAEPDVARDQDRLRRLGKDLAELGEIVAPYREYQAALQQAEEARSLAKEESDPEMAGFLREEAEAADARASELRSRLEALLVPKDPNDGKDVVVEIRAGAGGDEAALWAGTLFDMYRHEAERLRWKTEVLSASPSDLGGFKEVVLEVKGKDAYARLKFESGVHRVQRVPVTESSGRIHTSTATVAVLPEAEDVEVEIRQEDLKVDVFRSSGPGGQSVNTTDSAVRITHLPTGIVVTCQNERSQIKNREMAMKVLKARLFQRQQQEQAAHLDQIRGQVMPAEFGSQIRNYVLQPYTLVKDVRTGYEVGNTQAVLDGEIDPFIEAWLRWRLGQSSEVRAQAN